MRRFLLLVLLSLAVAELRAQPAPTTAPATLSSRREAAQVSLSAVYQRYEGDETTISQVSFPLAAYVPVGRRLSLTLYAGASQASGTVDGVDLAGLDGLSDAQVIVGYGREIGGASLVVTLGANLPSGRHALSDDEFETLRQLSRDVYRFRTPSFGQGLNLSPGLTWAMPLGHRVVLGAGLSYQHRGSFEPLADMEQRFDPGDELAFTGGLNYRLGRTAALSGDVTYTTYGVDRQGEVDLYESGDKTTVTLQLRSFFGYDEMRLVAHYRSRGKSNLPAVAAGADARMERLVPDQMLLRAVYRLRVRRALVLGLTAQGRRYDAAAGFDAQTLLDVGVAPEVGLAGGLSLLAQLTYTTGSFSGIEAGVGMSARF